MAQTVTNVDPQALAASLRRLSEESGPSSLRDSLRRVVESCVHVFGVSGSGIMLADDESALRYAVSSGAAAQALERAQLETGEGPCVDTFVLDDAVTTRDLVADGRWPTLVRALGSLEVHGMTGVPVHLSGIVVGSLDVYLDRAHRWRDEELQALRRFGQVIDSLIEAAVRAHHTGELAEQLNYALDHRVPIERGVGYVMARDGVGHTEAFQRLRAASRASRRKIGDVAAELLETGRLPGERE